MISIIIPALNEEKAIEETIRSVRAAALASGSDYEIIVADGGSTDKTVEIAKSLADLVVIHPKDKPQTISSNRNNGASHARGDFFVFIDAGATIANTEYHFKRALSHFENDRNLVALTTAVYVRPDAETFMDGIVFGIMTLNFIVINNILHKGAAQGKFQMIRREAFQKLGGFREDLPASEDMDMFSRLAKIGRTKIDYRLKVFHPGRRAHTIGWPKLLFIWWRDGFYYTFFNRVVSKHWMRTDYSKKVSLIIPARNEENYIGTTLESLQGIGHPNMEIIVVDNGSTDATAQIVSAFANIKLVCESRLGTQYAREHGRTEASGDILAFIDADCLYTEEGFLHGLSYFDRPGVVAVTGPCDYYDMPAFFRRFTLLLQKSIYKPTHYLLQLIKIGGIMQGGNCLIRKDALEAIGGFNTAITFYGDDSDTARKLIKTGTVIYSNKMIIKTSGRRFKGQGIALTLYLYIINFLWITIFKKPFTRSKLSKKEAL